MKKVRNGFINNLRYFCLLAAITLGLMAIVATGGGGGGGGGDNLTLADLVGTYNLSGFTVTFSDGTVITQDDVNSYSGTMTIESDGNATQEIYVNGYGGIIYAEILSVDNDSIRVSSGGCTYDLRIELSGNVLTTTAPMGTCGNDFSEVDVWTKISSDVSSQSLIGSTSLTPENSNFQTAIDELSDQAISGGGIGYIYKTLP